MTEIAARTVGSLGQDQFHSLLQSGLAVRLGPFNTHLTAETGRIAKPLYALYRDYALLDGDNAFSFHVRLEERRAFPRIDRRLVRLLVDGRAPHEDFPVAQALPVLEWGLNLVIALRSHCYLMLHAAVVAVDDQGLLLPASPGSGKTTLSAALALSGWRLLSDEFGLMRPGTTDLVPIPRPMALKNESIDVVRQFSPDAFIGPITRNTRKGDVAHLRPPASSISASDQTAKARWIVFPRWAPDSECVLTELSKYEAFMMLATNAFNYELLGESGYDTVSKLVESADCFDLVYSDLGVAVGALTDVLRQ